MAKPSDMELAEATAERISHEVSVGQQHQDILPDHEVLTAALLDHVRVSPTNHRQ